SRNFPEPDFEHWSLDYDSDSISDSDDWSELTEDLDAAVLSIDTAQVDSDHADVNQPAYVVQSGDTIKSIASRYTYPSARAEDMANAILRMNSSLRSNVEGNLVPGQIVILPNPDQLNVISSDNSELLSKEEGVFAKKKFYVHKQKPFYGEEKKVLRKKNIGKNHLLNNHHVTKKNVVRVESAVLSSTGLGSSEEDIISEHHKKSYDPGAVSAQVNALREEIEKLKQKIKEEKTTVADVGNGSGSSVISKSHKSEAVNLVPVPKTIVPVPNTSVPELAQDVKISGKTNIGPGHNNLLPPPGLVIPEQGSYDGDKSVVDLLMTLISSPAAITIAVVVCVL
ncbi:LysM peptidoglycan-binding domain-containing protein, partial [Candidatus Ichthyocystis sparus]|uniref:LysM peptidoglycan-binding domain-containing protein n=1 Tax=Candidatus Ichthyocystis sparus TaxID=1561004 RepID=UPI00114635D3